MRDELVIPLGTLIGFLLVLTRLSAVFVFVPVPGQQSGFSTPRALLCFALTIALAPQWPEIQADRVTAPVLAAWILSEAALGLTVGLAVSFIAEAFVFAAQVLSLQAGYGYASIIDPATQADSGILMIVAQLLAGLLFFAFGIDRHVLRALAESLTVYPPGAFAISKAAADEVLRLATTVLNTGLRLALPISGLMILIDLALSVLGRVHAQIQLVHMSFPVKLLLCLGVLGGMLLVAQPLYSAAAGVSLKFVARLLTR
jgi:flagellar biosynthesis protein FliR